MPNRCLQYSRLHLQYAAAAGNLISRKDISDIEQLQDQTVQFIAGIKARDGVVDAKTKTGLIPLHKKKRDRRLTVTCCPKIPRVRAIWDRNVVVVSWLLHYYLIIFIIILIL